MEEKQMMNQMDQDALQDIGMMEDKMKRGS